MASYTLPASAITHSHHAHEHIRTHSHSHSLSRKSSFSASPSKSLRHEGSNGSLHTHQRLAHIHYDGHAQLPGQAHNEENIQEPTYSKGLARIPDHTEKAAFSTTAIEISEPSLSLTETTQEDYNREIQHDHLWEHSHGHSYVHSYGHSLGPVSNFTSFLLPMVYRYPLLHTILADKDSRRIVYFMSLNFAFMVVQAVYGMLTDSLGLLSDSIHMLFDCLALGVGLFAAVASKWPASERFPYGFGKIKSLSGFGNGVFLMLISIEIMIEAIERLADGREMKRLGELFIVSSLGLVVNLVGMACFGHHHHGHDHGNHSHEHHHSHATEHSHPQHHNQESCNHHHEASHVLSDSKAATKPHSHSHENENMRGIFLHVLADTMGSAAVVVSTLMIRYLGWSGWDPLASCLIAILIFLSSIPLVTSSARKLLLTVPDDVEYTLRDTLGGVANLRGVDCVSVPRFWMGDKNAETEHEMVFGVMHICATRGSDIEDVRERTRAFLEEHGMDIVVQVEVYGDMSCWCGGSNGRSVSSSRFS